MYVLGTDSYSGGGPHSVVRTHVYSSAASTGGGGNIFNHFASSNRLYDDFPCKIFNIPNEHTEEKQKKEDKKKPKTSDHG